MDPIDITAAVHKKRLTLVQISLAAGLCKTACGYALRRPSRRAEEAIVKALGVKPHVLWPGRYDTSGRRRVRHRTSRTPIPDTSAQRPNRGQP